MGNISLVSSESQEERKEQNLIKSLKGVMDKFIRKEASQVSSGSECSQMARKASKDYSLEDLYCSETTDKSMELSALRDITNKFSKETKIGKGGFAVVYRVRAYTTYCLARLE